MGIPSLFRRCLISLSLEKFKNQGNMIWNEGLTVLMGISIGGGLTPKAAPNRTKIVREVEGKKIEIKVKMETLVQPGDTIIVPESFF